MQKWEINKLFYKPNFFILVLIYQIENEYEATEKKLGASGEAYLKWAAEMAVGQNTGVPWVMCKEDDAPDPIVSNPATVLMPKTLKYHDHSKLLTIYR